MNELITKESLSYFKRKYDERVARKLGGIYSKYETNESSIGQTMMEYVYNNTPDCIIVHTNKGEEQHYLRMMDKTYACVIGSVLCTFTIEYSNDEYSMEVEQYNLGGDSDNSLIIPLAESGGSWSASVSFSDIRDAMEDGNDIYFSINGAIVSTTLREAGNNSFTLMASMTDTQNSLLKVFSVFANSGIVSATCNQYTLTAYIPPQPVVETWNISYDCEGCTFVDGGGDLPASIANGEPLSLSYSLDEATDYNLSVTMGADDITGSAVDRNNQTLYISSVEDNIDIYFRYFRELSYSDNIGEDGDPEVEIYTSMLAGGYEDGEGMTIELTPANEGGRVSLTSVTANGDDITSEITVEEISGGAISFFVTISGDMHIEASIESEEPETVSVYNILNGVQSSEYEIGRSEATVGESWFTELTPTNGYPIQSVTVYMGSSNITSTAWYPPEQGGTQGTVEIDDVQGDIYIFALAGDPSTSFSVTDNSSSGVTFDNLPVNLSIGQGGTYHYSVDPEYTYAGQSVYMNGNDISDLSTWYGDNYVFIPPAVGYVEITVEADELPEMSIDWNLTDVTASPQPMSVVQGGDFGPILLTSDNGNDIEVVVMMGEDDVTEMWFNSSTNTIQSDGGVWDTVSIEAHEVGDEPEEGNTYSVTYDFGDPAEAYIWSEPNEEPEIITEVEEGETFSCIIVPESGYSDIGVTVTMGGVTVPNAYNEGDGSITVANVTGPIVVTARGIQEEPEEPEEPDYDYGLNLQLSYCDAPDAPDGFTAGENVDIELIPYDGYTLDFPTKLTITMGGVDITEQAYGYPGASGHAHIYINNVSGDVVAIVSAGEF